MAYKIPTTRDEAAAALDAGQLFVNVNQHQRWWVARRNGKTQTWKRASDRFRIPFKVGMNGYGAIDEGNLKTFRIATSRDEAQELVSDTNPILTEQTEASRFAMPS